MRSLEPCKLYFEVTELSNEPKFVIRLPAQSYFPNRSPEIRNIFASPWNGCQMILSDCPAYASLLQTSTVHSFLAGFEQQPGATHVPQRSICLEVHVAAPRRLASHKGREKMQKRNCPFSRLVETPVLG